MWAARGEASPSGEGACAGSSRADRGKLEGFPEADIPLFQFSCIARGTYVLAEYTAIQEGEEEVLSSVSRRALLKLPKTAGRRSYVFDSRLFSFFVDATTSTVFMCVTDENINADLPWQFLSELRRQYHHLLGTSVDGAEVRPADATRILIRLVVRLFRSVHPRVQPATPHTAAGLRRTSFSWRTSLFFEHSSFLARRQSSPGVFTPL
ncbi:synaptobrevin protein [Toxoplasma gondii TgCatPRC2]|uniref:Synaptobrevin protein n=1 Tax=Toxoplasma gondii TgCatPRC2 TaxID=1130821 RepID=A0A151HG02_TOXGO|nr:synaptobrevin protein [Toxoplasma gondii TgCatPRC2]